MKPFIEKTMREVFLDRPFKGGSAIADEKPFSVDIVEGDVIEVNFVSLEQPEDKLTTLVSSSVALYLPKPHPRAIKQAGLGMTQ